MDGSGAGGGAISGSTRRWKSTIQAGFTVSANGSKNNQAETNDRNGGGGSGGSILFVGDYIVNNGAISAKEEPVSCPVVVVDVLRSFDPVLLREQSMLVLGIIQVRSLKTLHQ